MPRSRYLVLVCAWCLLAGTYEAQSKSKFQLKFTSGANTTTVDATSINRSYQALCTHKSVTAELDGANAATALKTLKKGDRVGTVGVFGDGTLFLFRHTLHDVVVSDVLQRKNGTARVSLDYGRCEQVR